MKKTGKQRVRKLTLYLVDDLRKALRMQAIREDTSATRLVERLVVDYLDQQRQQRQERHRQRKVKRRAKEEGER